MLTQELPHRLLSMGNVIDRFEPGRSSGKWHQYLPLKTPSPGEVNLLQTYSPCYPKSGKVVFLRGKSIKPTPLKLPQNSRVLPRPTSPTAFGWFGFDGSALASLSRPTRLSHPPKRVVALRLPQRPRKTRAVPAKITGHSNAKITCHSTENPVRFQRKVPPLAKFQCHSSEIPVILQRAPVKIKARRKESSSES